jgi:hypothetical protein
MPTSSRARLSVVLVVASLAACGESRASDDAGTGMDATTERDGGAAFDGGPRIDASSLDAAFLDAEVLDAPPADGAMVSDGASIDAPIAPDGGPLPCSPTCTACDLAAAAGSTAGCEHYVVDLDNAALGAGRDASAQPFAIMISNPGPDAAMVVVERSTAPFGSPPSVVMLASVTVLAGSAETLTLGRHEVDGSSASGIDDGTHTALSANALRVRSTRPVAIHQLNPEQGVGNFSNDGSLVLPVHALGARYGVVGWPQTIANSLDPAHDFDPSRTDEDLRAFLTVVGTTAATRVTVTLGPDVRRVLGAGSIPIGSTGSMITVDLGPFEVLNLETEAFLGDFSGSLIAASAPVAVFVGTEASDVPAFATLAERRCCADHLETQLAPDDRAGRRFVVARMPSRSAALNAAFVGTDSVAELPVVEWIRIVALEPGTTTITTTLPAPDDRITMTEREWIELRVDRDFVLDADHRVSIVQALPSQEVTGIPNDFPGGDPSIFWLPAVEHHRTDFAFSIPAGYAFDELVIVAPAAATIRMDDAALPSHCVSAPLGVDWIVRRCAMSFPDVIGRPAVRIEPGLQNDGFHTLSGDQPFGAIVSGFDSFVSYAYSAGATLPRP